MTDRFKSGIKARYSGRYRCAECNSEKTVVKGKRLIACKCGGKEWLLISFTGKMRNSDKSFLDRLFS
jgi:DNA-directed RNA polymerase subunit RPC12/RpoP